MVLDLDLTSPPPNETVYVVRKTVYVVRNYVFYCPQVMQSSRVRISQWQVPNFNEDVDDEITIGSPRNFAVARRHQAKRKREVNEDHSARKSTSACPHERAQANGRTVCGCGCMNMNKTVAVPPRPKAPVLNCPICMDPLVEETATKCGHIFCNKCINKALAARKKCPTCRKNLKQKDIFRIYLPM